MNLQMIPWPPPIILFLVLSHVRLCFCNPVLLYESCKAKFNCGNVRNSDFPFRGSDEAKYCGVPGFELKCEDNSITTIDFGGLKYRVLEIKEKEQSMRIARNDMMDAICPQILGSKTLDFLHFEYESTYYRNVSFRYGCRQPSALGGLKLKTPCMINGIDYLEVFVDLLALEDPWDCKASVTVQVNDQGDWEKQIGNLTHWEEDLKDGIWVKWKWDYSKECGECVESGGRCAYEVPDLSNYFYCLCPNASFSLSADHQKCIPPPGGKSKLSTGAGIGIGGAGIAGILLIGSLAYCMLQRRKRIISQTKSKDLSNPSSKGLTTPSTTFSQSIPSYPSSSSADLEKGSMYFGVQMFTYAELEEATDNFDASRELGDGGFGVVYFGKLRDGREVAVKRLYENNFKRVEQFMNEVEILTRLRHQNLVMLYGCTSRRSRELLLVYEYIPNGTVADHLHGQKENSGLVSWPVRLGVALETADALAYLHASDIIHRDVKTNNILLDKNFRVKVADFGLSRLFPTNVTHVSTAPQGTPGYVDPEYYQCYQLTNKSDVYSFGVVLVELISSKEAVDTNRHRHDINLANMALSKIQNHALHELVDPCLGFETNYTVRRTVTLVAELAFRCLQQEREVRPSMDEVLKVLRGIQVEELNAQKAETADTGADDVGLLKGNAFSFSPDSVVNAKWASNDATPNSF